MMQALRPNILQRNRYAGYVEAVSKHSGDKVGFFECPHCAAIFDAFAAAQLALNTCVAHARICAKRARE
jgi:hypothetical protein